jgi:hypothetical protein
MLTNQNYQLLSSLQRSFAAFILRIASIIFVTCCCAAGANTLRVPADFATIQGALDAASPGDSILVAEGTYTENIVWPQTSDLHLLSDPANANRPTIDGASAGRVIDIEADGSSAFTAEISGFIITHGFLDVPAHTGETGAGIFMTNGALRLSQCVIDANEITSSFPIQNNGGGAGVSVVSTPTGSVNHIDGCTFSHNSVSAVTSGDGAAIHLDTAPLVMTNTDINGNGIDVAEVGLGTIYDFASDLVMDSVKVEENQAQTHASLPVGFAAIKGTAVFSYLSNVRIVNCKIATNLSTPQNSTLTLLGAAVYFYSEGTKLRITSSSIGYNKRTDAAGTNGTALYFSSLVPGTALVVNSILWNPDNGAEIDSFSEPALVYLTDVRDNPNRRRGNINADPLFVSPLDFHLQPTSRCLNAGYERFAPPLDIEGMPRPRPAGSKVDLGCYEMN